jgi:hypothetical protein
MPVQPYSLYGVSKVFGESLGGLYADKLSRQAASRCASTQVPATASRAAVAQQVSAGPDRELPAGHAVANPAAHNIL